MPAPIEYVVDASVILAVALNEPERPLLIAKTQGAILYAPHSLPFEIGNALSAGFKRNRLTLAEAMAALSAYQQMSIQLVDIDLANALNLAHRLNVYAYDAYMIECALRQNCTLITRKSYHVHYRFGLRHHFLIGSAAAPEPSALALLWLALPLAGAALRRKN